MKVGIVVDGDAESQALRLLTERFDIEDVQLLAPAYANMQPKSAPGQIAQSAKWQETREAFGVFYVLSAIRSIFRRVRDRRTTQPGYSNTKRPRAHSIPCTLITSTSLGLKVMGVF